MWEIVHGVLVLAVIWWIIFKVSDAIQNLPWLERRRLQKVFDSANNWKPPKRTPEMSPATYRVVYSDGKCGDRSFVPIEIEGWAVRCNNDNTAGKFPYCVLRILDAKGNIVWPALDTMPRTYQVVPAKGEVYPVILPQSEIEGWVKKINNNKKKHVSIVRVQDSSGNIVWQNE